jgi:UDP-galactopyranose mutase
MFDFLIVGAGFAGSVLAERLAHEDGARVLIIDRRSHIAGNAFDTFDDAGILIHKYGPHIFHANAPEIFAYLSQFTEWRPYQHRVLASVEGRLVPIPINLDTINTLFGLNLTSDELTSYFESVAEPRAHSHRRGRGREQGRSPSLQHLLSGLHAQAVGSRPG